MENVFTLMIFASGQVQAIVMQYKTYARAAHDRDALKREIGAQITLSDDYGRELSMRPNGDEIALIQDVDLAAEGNLIANVKNGISQAMTQVRTGEELNKYPGMKSAMIRAQLSNGAGQGGPFRQ